MLKVEVQLEMGGERKGLFLGDLNFCRSYTELILVHFWVSSSQHEQ